ncbi:unnamed protein product [Caenorhabditis bovis]|uniref:F-box domain-containing protein n=1 Tax=Caenorhabditis bovis TaxID=2654633 RepID=A0A8S1F8T0_9PELO|nr:unnamed protein product [Caenorhabditis bovis]
MSTETPRSRHNLRRTAARVASSSPGSLTKFFGVRKRLSEASTPFIKRKRSVVSDGAAVPSPISTNVTPIRIIHENNAENSPRPRFVNKKSKTEFGVFDDLPVVVVRDILHNLPYAQLGSLSCTSVQWKKVVQNYFQSKAFDSRLMNDIYRFMKISNPSKYTSEDPFYSLGVALRRLGATESKFSQKLRPLENFLKRILAETNSYDGCGRAIHAFAENHDELSPEDFESMVKMGFSLNNDLENDLKNIVFKKDEEHRNLDHRITAKSMKILEEEFKVRQMIRDLFLNNRFSDPDIDTNRHFLTCLIASYKSSGTDAQSRFLYLLYAPTREIRGIEVINWHAFADLVIHTEDEATSNLRPLASALKALVVSKKTGNKFSWSKNSVFNLMEEVTTYPAPWSMNTFVSFLLMQPCLIPISIVARMLRSHEEEAGDMISTMKLLLFRWNIKCEQLLTPVFDSIRVSLSEEKRKVLYDNIWNWHRRNSEELRGRLDSFADHRAELQSQIDIMPLLEKLVSP